MLEKSFGVVHLLILLFLILIVFGILLLLVLRLATWLNKKFPQRPGRRVSIAGVVIGGLTDVFASSVLALPVVMYLQIKGSAAIASVINSGGWLYWLQLAIGLGCSGLGGYVAAWIAKHDELLNGLLSSILCTAIGLYSILLGKGAQSLRMQILLLAAASAFALLGGYLRQKQKSISRAPGIVGPVA
jgi:MFS family permease